MHGTYSGFSATAISTIYFPAITISTPRIPVRNPVPLSRFPSPTPIPPFPQLLLSIDPSLADLPIVFQHRAWNQDSGRLALGTGR